MCASGFGVILPLFFIIFFFYFFDLVFSRSDYYKNRYLVAVTPPRVFYGSFGNYAYLFYMVCRCVCRFGVILLFSTYLFNLFQVQLLLTLWAQHILEFYTCHFQTMQAYSTWSVDVHVVWGCFLFYQLLLLFRLSFSRFD